MQSWYRYAGLATGTILGMQAGRKSIGSSGREQNIHVFDPLIRYLNIDQCLQVPYRYR